MRRLKFEAKILKIVQRTHDVKSLIFKRPENFDYKPGQYILVTVNIEGESTTKALTISTSPTETNFLEFTKKLTGHPFSNTLDAMKTDDVISINGPFGKLTFEGEYPKIALLCGGIGVTPMISICKYCSDLQLDANISLVYSNKTEHDIAFMPELEEMKSINSNLKVVYTLTRADEKWVGCKERICENLIVREISDYKERQYYLCGSPEMLNSVEEVLLLMNIPKGKIKKEVFSGY